MYILSGRSRLSTIRNAHVIAVIDDGKVAEQGSHSHLLKNYPDGCYARMIQLQRFTHNHVIGMASGSTTSARTKEDEIRHSRFSNKLKYALFRVL